MQNQPGNPETQWTLLSLLRWATSYFQFRHIESPRASAEILLAHALGIRRIDLYLRHDQPLDATELKQFKALIKRRIAREPIAYIVGFKEFWSMKLRVTPEVLIPRPETECLIEAIQKHLLDTPGLEPKRILELGTGSGAIILALASISGKHHYFASDRKGNVLEVARSNARRHLGDGAVSFFAGNWLDPLKPGGNLFDIIVSNPPYIDSKTIPTLAPEISEYEPLEALDGGEKGLSCIRQIIAGAHGSLKAGGRLFMEIGHDQKDGVQHLFNTCGRYEQIVFKKDYSGYDRVVRAVKAG
jgi:release factor glutamine methyltransferase